MKRKTLLITLLVLALTALLLAGGGVACLFSAIVPEGKALEVCIDRDDDADSVYAKLADGVGEARLLAVKLLATADGYGEKVKPGRYCADHSLTCLDFYRRLRSGGQTPVRITLPYARTMQQVAARLAPKLEADSADLVRAFTDSVLCAKHGVSVATLPCLFIPDTYEVYWTITPEELMARMEKEKAAFWNAERRRKAEEAGLSIEEVCTLASIVDAETANNAEKPAIAGMYINRLRRGMFLQADPTVKFALGDFGLRRILHKHLEADSPYNTYRHKGLPPGPIAVPTVAGINAVLNYEHHNYIYMCAKEDFSGTHRFAATFAEHKINARRYARALNQRNIH